MYKVEAGAEFAITQPVFDVSQLERFLREIDGVRIPVIAGIWPLVSVRNAEFLANEVPGVVVPESILKRMRVANEKSRSTRWQKGSRSPAKCSPRSGVAWTGYRCRRRSARSILHCRSSRRRRNPFCSNSLRRRQSGRHSVRHFPVDVRIFHGTSPRTVFPDVWSFREASEE